MPKIGEILKSTQPEEYAKLKEMAQNKRKNSDEKCSFREIEDLMCHDGYRRDGGVIRQVRHGRY
ncbi:MAG: hypothetical protein AB7E31_04295 [Desulfitobacterium sp.]